MSWTDSCTSPPAHAVCVPGGEQRYTRPRPIARKHSRSSERNTPTSMSPCEQVFRPTHWSTEYPPQRVQFPKLPNSFWRFPTATGFHSVGNVFIIYAERYSSATARSAVRWNVWFDVLSSNKKRMASISFWNEMLRNQCQAALLKPLFVCRNIGMTPIHFGSLPIGFRACPRSLADGRHEISAGRKPSSHLFK